MVQIQLKNPGKIFSVNSELSYFNMAICNSNTQWPRGNTLIPKARDRAKKEEKEAAWIHQSLKPLAHVVNK